MHRLASIVLLLGCASGLLVSCAKDKAEDKAPPPAVAPTTPTPTATPDAALVADAPEADAMPADAAIEPDAPAKVGKPGGVKGKAMYKDTTPANSPPFPVANCSVVVTDVVTKEERTTKTNAKGEYRLELPPGSYTVNLQACKKGSLDCANPGKQPTTNITIADGEWSTFGITSNSCTKCLDASAPIATPDGPVAIDHLRVGDRIYVVRGGKRIVTTVAAMQRVPATNQARRFVLADGRIVVGSAPHPLGDGRAFGTIAAGDLVDGARVERVELVPYRDGHAYDLLPAIDAAYLVDGVPVRSTMSP